MDFSIKINLPSGKTIRVPELKNKDYFTILKFCENEDLEGLCIFLDSCFFSKLTGLDIIDKFYTLLLVRMVYIDPELVLENKDKESINFNIQNIIDNIDSAELDFNKVYRSDKYMLNLGLPDSLYFDSLNDILLGIIKKIQIADTEINFSNLNEQEKEEVLNYIPNSIFTILKRHVELISSDLGNFVVINSVEEFGIKGINLDIVSNGVITFLMSMFSTGLSSFFEMMYVFTNRLKFTARDFFELTPLDSRVILNIHKKELADKEAELKNREEV